MFLQSLSSFWGFAQAVADHLWQSTLFVAAAGLLTLALRKNSARLRYSLWLAASLKFLVPFSLLVALGNSLSWRHLSTAPNTGMYVIEIHRDIRSAVHETSVADPASGQSPDAAVAAVSVEWVMVEESARAAR